MALNRMPIHPFPADSFQLYFTPLSRRIFQISESFGGICVWKVELSASVPCTSEPVILTSFTLPSCTAATKSDTTIFLGGLPRPVLTAIQTRTTAHRMTIQKTAVFTFEFMNSPFTDRQLSPASPGNHPGIPYNLPTLSRRSHQGIRFTRWPDI